MSLVISILLGTEDVVFCDKIDIEELSGIAKYFVELNNIKVIVKNLGGAISAVKEALAELNEVKK